MPAAGGTRVRVCSGGRPGSPSNTTAKSCRGGWMWRSGSTVDWTSSTVGGRVTVWRRWSRLLEDSSSGLRVLSGSDNNSSLVQEEEMPEEVNIDELLDLKTDEEKTHRLQNILHSCNNSTEVFINELVFKLQGLQKQEDLHNDGIDLPQLHIYPSHSGSGDREVLH
uniref:Protein phosphatase 1 regulatory inhibitor subunit 14A n=1 Tax=Seriola dumerili TaxID=41447 RepID=A0A3B4TKK0_SERDU